MLNSTSRRTALVLAPVALLSLAAAGIAVKLMEPPPGQFRSIAAVLAHYSAAPAASFERSEFKPLALSQRELEQLTAFLGAL